MERVERSSRPRSWKLACKGKGDALWAYNGLRFATEEACAIYGLDLYRRWAGLDQWEAHPSEDEPNQKT